MLEISEAKAIEILRRNWGYDSFRPAQFEVLSALMNYNQVLALLPTGGGKSLCYQVPALLLNGITIVISPLISLMEDQISDLKDRGINAACIHSGVSLISIDRILDNCIYGTVKLLYVSPERLKTDLFLGRVSQMKIELLVVDEAHCISQWGHDFRPAYLAISEFISSQNIKNVIGLTATANGSTIKDIYKQLLFSTSSSIVRKSFLRKNIHINVDRIDDKINHIAKIVSKHANSKILIYCRSRRQVEMLAETLKSMGRSTAYYHAGLSFKIKKRIQSEFKNSKISIVCATNAFGMGIDISDIRTVIHYGIPPSIEEYYQEIGRAGRDSINSYAYLVYNEADKKYLSELVTLDFIGFDELYDYYKKICILFQVQLSEGEGRNFSLDLSKIATHFSVRPKNINGIINGLSVLGLLKSEYNPKDQHFVKLQQSARNIREQYDNTSFKELLFLIMRKYNNVWENYAELTITDLSDELNSSEQLLIQQLKQLKKKGVIKFIEIEQGPRLVFLTNRIDKRSFESKRNHYEKLKELKRDRLKSILNFITSKQCRSIILSEYFGEVVAKSCSNCDMCNTSYRHVKDIRKYILSLDTKMLKTYIEESIESKNREALQEVQSLHSEGLISIDLEDI